MQTQIMMDLWAIWHPVQGSYHVLDILHIMEHFDRQIHDRMIKLDASAYRSTTEHCEGKLN